MTAADDEKARSKPAAKPKPGAEAEREARLKAALKANMARRKAQARARAVRATPADEAGSTTWDADAAIPTNNERG